jgi:catechol 2,3-dioxygenase-like lactoylglutathione lyase family enzyme
LIGQLSDHAYQLRDDIMATNTVFDFKGLDHVGLTCSDMKATVDFYHGKLGMPVLHTIEYFDDKGELMGQHWFFGVGEPSNPDAHIAFFWWKDGYQTLSKEELSTGKKPPNPIAGPIGSMLHVNLRVDPENMEAYAKKLTDLGIPYRHVTRYPCDKAPQGMRGITTWNEYHQPEVGALMNSIYFFDPDGIHIEFNTWTPDWRSWRNDHIPLTNESKAKPETIPAVPAQSFEKLSVT